MTPASSGTRRADRRPGLHRIRHSPFSLSAVCFGVLFTDMLGYGLIAPNIPLLAATVGATDAQMGYAFAGYPIVFTMAVVPLGRLVDRVGQNARIVSASMFVLAGATATMAFLPSIWMLVVARGLQGLASAAAWTATQPLLARDRGATSTTSGRMAVATIASGTGIVVGPLLGGIGDRATPFVIAAVIALCCGLLAAVFLRSESSPASIVRPALRTVLDDPHVRIACVTIFCSCACLGAMELLLPLELDRLGYTKLAVGALFGAFALLYVVTQPVIGRWINRRGPHEPLVIGSVGLGALMPVVAHVAGPTAYAVLMAAIGTCGGMLFLGSMVQVAGRSDEACRGTAYALWNLAFSAGYLLGPVGGGTISSAIGLPVVFHVFAVLPLSAAVWLYLTNAWTNR